MEFIKYMHIENATNKGINELKRYHSDIAKGEFGIT